MISITAWLLCTYHLTHIRMSSFVYALQDADVKYIDPTYMIRAIPTISTDRIYCKILAHNAVHAAFAGMCIHTLHHAATCSIAWCDPPHEHHACSHWGPDRQLGCGVVSYCPQGTRA